MMSANEYIVHDRRLRLNFAESRNISRLAAQNRQNVDSLISDDVICRGSSEYGRYDPQQHLQEYAHAYTECDTERLINDPDGYQSAFESDTDTEDESTTGRVSIAMRNAMRWLGRSLNRIGTGRVNDSATRGFRHSRKNHHPEQRTQVERNSFRRLDTSSTVTSDAATTIADLPSLDNSLVPFVGLDDYIQHGQQANYSRSLSEGSNHVASQQSTACICCGRVLPSRSTPLQKDVPSQTDVLDDAHLPNSNRRMHHPRSSTNGNITPELVRKNSYSPSQGAIECANCRVINCRNRSARNSISEIDKAALATLRSLLCAENSKLENILSEDVRSEHLLSDCTDLNVALDVIDRVFAKPPLLIAAVSCGDTGADSKDAKNDTDASFQKNTGVGFQEDLDEMTSSNQQVDFLQSQNEKSKNQSGIQYLDIDLIKKLYKLVNHLPAGRAACMKAIAKHVKRPETPITTEALAALFVILLCPFLNPRHSKIGTGANRTRHAGISVLKRVLGLISSCNNELHRYFVHWLRQLNTPKFSQLLELLNVFVAQRISSNKDNLGVTSGNSQRRSGNVQENDWLNNFGQQSDSSDLAGPQYCGRANRNSVNNESSRDGRGNQQGTSNWRRRSGSILDGIATVVAGSTSQTRSYTNDWQLRSTVRVMALLFAANKKTHKLPLDAFYCTMVDAVDVSWDFESWQHRSNGFTFCQYPFLLSIGAKAAIMEYDARRQMEAMAREAFFSLIRAKGSTSPYFKITVRRRSAVGDSLEQIAGRSYELKKSLRIEFVGEDGVDAGGLRKEWFLILCRELFQRDNGLFVWEEDSNNCWFNPASPESPEQFYLVGVVVGLAVYNSIILDIPLPRALYKKLLGMSCDIDDLAQIRPALARGLRQLLRCSDKEYGIDEQIYDLDFTVRIEHFGENSIVELVPDGCNTPVTHKNKELYVKRYISFLLDESVSQQFDAFRYGFLRVCGGNAISLFQPEELEVLAHGSGDTVDIAQLQAMTITRAYCSPTNASSMGSGLAISSRTTHGHRRANQSGSRIARWANAHSLKRQTRREEPSGGLSRSSTAESEQYNIDRRDRPNESAGMSGSTNGTTQQDSSNTAAAGDKLNEEDDERKCAQVVEWFWSVLHESDEQTKRRILSFVTGTDRLPVTRIANYVFRISILGLDCERLPTAHTCFNEICMYAYSSKAKLRRLLLRAVFESAGFDLS